MAPVANEPETTNGAPLVLMVAAGTARTVNNQLPPAKLMVLLEPPNSMPPITRPPTMLVSVGLTADKLNRNPAGHQTADDPGIDQGLGAACALRSQYDVIGCPELFRTMLLLAPLVAALMPWVLLPELVTVMLLLGPAVDALMPRVLLPELVCVIALPASSVVDEKPAPFGPELVQVMAPLGAVVQATCAEVGAAAKKRNR